MKKALFSATLLLTFALSGLAQRAAYVGTWAGEGTGPDGQMVKFKMIIAEDSYQLDMGMDGNINVVGKVVAEGDQVSVWDVSGELACPGDQKGVYKFAVDGDTLTFTKVEDPCEGRGSDAVLVLKRM